MGTPAEVEQNHLDGWFCSKCLSWTQNLPMSFQFTQTDFLQGFYTFQIHPLINYGLEYRSLTLRKLYLSLGRVVFQPWKAFSFRLCRCFRDTANFLLELWSQHSRCNWEFTERSECELKLHREFLGCALKSSALGDLSVSQGDRLVFRAGVFLADRQLFLAHRKCTILADWHRLFSF